ncbi:MAG: peptide deformylase [Ignavibacteria bacterium GWF2_33_9]|nr:MAG: peptide deformylase [Ignavibacteria bacterium GWF2_33_9]
MAVKPIYNCYHPVLNNPTIPFENIDGEAIQVVQDLFDTLKSISNGVGLAANQIGINRSALVIDLMQVKEYRSMKPLAMINPVIEHFSDNIVEMEEGCLSVPDLYEGVNRPESIVVSYYDVHQKHHREEVSGYLARVMQHEIDHLNGILFYQRFTPLKKTLTKNKLKKIQKGLLLPDYPFVTAEGELINP